MVLTAQNIKSELYQTNRFISLPEIEEVDGEIKWHQGFKTQKMRRRRQTTGFCQ